MELLLKLAVCVCVGMVVAYLASKFFPKQVTAIETKVQADVEKAAGVEPSKT